MPAAWSARARLDDGAVRARAPRPRAAPWPRRVLLVVDSLAAGGGAERYVVDLGRELRRRGVGVELACSAGGPLRDELHAASIPVHVASGRIAKRRFDPSYARRLRRLVRDGDFDLVHAHLYASIAAAAVATARTSVPLVVTEHTEAPWRGPAARLTSRLAYRHAAEITAVSTAIRDVLVERFGVPERKVTFVRNAVTAHDGSAAGPLPGGCEDALLIGRVGRLQPEKGMETFVDAAALLSRRWPDVRFLVLGDGPLRARLEQRAEARGVGDRLHFLGCRADARALIARLDVLAISSLTDGSPLAILEAMASGIPVVATRCGGIPDQVRDGVDGLLAEPGDATGFAAALERLLREPGTRRAMGAAGRRRAASEFGHARMVDRLQAVYARCGQVT